MNGALLVAATLGLILSSIAQAQPAYVDARNYPAPGMGVAAFDRLEERWLEGFDVACGDALCNGVYDYQRPFKISCSVRSADGILKSCHWAIVGTVERIDPEAGTSEYEVRSVICEIPLVADTPLQVLLATADDEDPFDDPLPGGELSAYWGIADCVGPGLSESYGPRRVR